MKYKDLFKPQQKIIDDHMPYILGFETDGRPEHNNMLLQHLLAYIGSLFVSRCDKIFGYCCCPGYSYLNTVERAMSIANIALASLAVSIDPDAPDWIMKVLSGQSSKQVCDVVYQYDNDLERAIKFKTENLFRNEMANDSNNSSDSDDEHQQEQEGDGNTYFPLQP
eukprot:13542244-Ditylum_brightwellii.AAC.1